MPTDPQTRKVNQDVPEYGLTAGDQVTVSHQTRAGITFRTEEERHGFLRNDELQPEDA